jgi:glycosyltransferase involved in cell wall biosynthesis
MQTRPLCVLHVAAPRDEVALPTLRRTAQVIATEGLAQVLLTLDDGFGLEPAWLAKLPSEVRRVRCAALFLLGGARALQRELARLSYEKILYAVHMHGLTACLLGWQALRTRSLEGKVLYSPHSTPFRMSWENVLFRRFLRAGLAPIDCSAALAASLAEGCALSRLLNRSVDVLPQAVSDIFFASPRTLATPAPVVAGGSGGEAVDLAARLCVLFNSREARLPFAWLGRTGRTHAAKLRAADVQVLDDEQDAETAQVLARASLYLHLSPHDYELHAVARAMAAGVPCLVSDALAYRAVVRNGETGYVCTSERDFVEKMTVLLRDGAERKRLGEAARAEAEGRFTLRHFETAVLRAYGFPERTPFRRPSLPASAVAHHAVPITS